MSDAILPRETKIISYYVKKKVPLSSIEVFNPALAEGNRGEQVRLGPEPKILGWKYKGETTVGTLSISKINLELLPLIQNTGTASGDFSFFITISNGQEVEYFYEYLIKDLKASEVREINIDKKWQPTLAGTHKILLEIFSTDKKTKYAELAESFDLAGQFKYDVVVSCKQTSVTAGNDIAATITLQNFGDYFEDVDVSWWIENPSGNRIGQSFVPLALQPREPKNIEENIFVPQNAAQGQYVFKAQVNYRGETRAGSCSFYVEGQELNFLLPILIVFVLISTAVGYLNRESLLGFDLKNHGHKKPGPGLIDKILGLK